MQLSLRFEGLSRNRGELRKVFFFDQPTFLVPIMGFPSAVTGSFPQTVAFKHAFHDQIACVYHPVAFGTLSCSIVAPLDVQPQADDPWCNRLETVQVLA